MSEKQNQKMKDNEEFQYIIREFVENETVQKMNDFRQHGDTTCFEHCYKASYYCYTICKKFNLDYASAARGAMLHDFFLYDWRIRGNHKLHAFTHGKRACKNASEIFYLNYKEKDIIKNHMWPTTIKPPKTREGFVLTLVDKYCAITETFGGMFKHLARRKFLRYAYMLAGVIFFKKNN